MSASNISSGHQGQPAASAIRPRLWRGLGAVLLALLIAVLALLSPTPALADGRPHGVGRYDAARAGASSGFVSGTMPGAGARGVEA